MYSALRSPAAFIVACLLLCLPALCGAQDSHAYFKIKVVDAQTGQGVPLVELETTNNLLYVTDSNGIVAFQEPGLMNRKVFFTIKSHGYEFPKDGFGYRGTVFQTVPGGSATLKMKRLNIAERLCRLTGAGIYADSLLTGESVPLREPALSGEVVGQDSALAAIYKGRWFWFWGDTARPSYPLGNFRTSGATATLPKGNTTAEKGLDFAYFTNSDGFARAMCPTQKPGPIWISGLVVLNGAEETASGATGSGKAAESAAAAAKARDSSGGKEEMLAYYARMENLGTKREHGYVQWDDANNVFKFIKELPLSETWRHIDGHPVRLTENGVTYLAGGFCFPVIRVRAAHDSLLDPAAYEAYTCLLPNGEVRRDAQGKAVYAWQKDAPPLLLQQEADLIKAGKLKPDEAHFLPHDSAGKQVVPHGGSVTWNPWRKKWLLIATQRGAKESELGEVVYGESDNPCGPWRQAVKIITHDRYTFYNPVHHPFLDAENGRIIYFEGTYTAEFSGNTHLTPRYNYNQILYRLDLSDPRLNTIHAN